MKPTGALARIAETKKNGEQLIADIERHLLQEAEDSFDPSNRRQDVIHPSEVAKSEWCPLSTYLRIKAAREGTLEAAEANRFQLQNIFDEGHAYHDKWQSRIRRMGRLFGRWKCNACGHRWDAVSPPGCPSCGVGEGAVTYVEVVLHDDAVNIHGHADGCVTAQHRVHADGDPLIEIKSIGEGTVRVDNAQAMREHTYEVPTRFGTKKVLDHRGLWSSIHAPFPSHLRQGYIYLRLFDSAKEIVFIYEYKATSAVKTYSIKRNDAAVDEIWSLCADIMFALDHPDTDPPRCASNKGICKECKPFRKGEDDAVEAPAEAGVRRGRPSAGRGGAPVRSRRGRTGTPGTRRGAPAEEVERGDPGGHQRRRGWAADRDDDQPDVVGGLRGRSTRGRGDRPGGDRVGDAAVAGEAPGADARGRGRGRQGEGRDRAEGGTVLHRHVPGPGAGSAERVRPSSAADGEVRVVRPARGRAQPGVDAQDRPRRTPAPLRRLGTMRAAE